MDLDLSAGMNTTQQAVSIREGMVRWGVQRGAQTLIRFSCSGTFNLHILHAQLCKVCALRVDVYSFVRAAMRAAVQEDDSYMWGVLGSSTRRRQSVTRGVSSRQGGALTGQKIKFVRPIVSNTLASDAHTNFGLGKGLLCPLTLLGRLLVPGHITFELAVVRHGVAAQNGGAYLGYPPPTCDCNCCCCTGSH